MIFGELLLLRRFDYVAFKNCRKMQYATTYNGAYKKLLNSTK